MKKLFVLMFVFSIFTFISCAQIVVDKDGRTICDKLVDALDNYDKPLIDSILNTNIDLKHEFFREQVNLCLHLAVNQNDILRFNKMFEKGARISIVPHSDHSESLLRDISAKEKYDFFQIWLNNTKTITNQTEELDKPLIWAVAEDNLDAVKMLIKKGANVNFIFPDNCCRNILQSPIQIAMDRNNLEMFEYLLSQKANVQQTVMLYKDTGYESKNATLLHYLMLSTESKNGKKNNNVIAMANILLDKGLDINALTENGLKAIDVVNFSNQHDFSTNQPWLIEFLVQRGTVLKSEGYSTAKNTVQSGDLGKMVFWVKKSFISWNEFNLDDKIFFQPRYVKALSGIKIREQPSTKSNVLTSAAYQAQVFEAFSLPNNEVIEGISGHWVYVKFNNKKGFVFSGFLQ